MAAAGLTGKLEVDVEVQTSPQKLWDTLRNSAEIFPKAFPDAYKSVEILEGDGKAVGSVRLVNFAEGLKPVTLSKERIDEVDEATKMMTYSVIGGEMTEALKSFKAKVIVGPKGDGSLLKWSCEYEKLKEDVPDPTFIIEFTTKLFKELDDYLLKPQAA